MRSCDGRSDPPATAPKELPKDHADDDLPALQASSDSDEDTTEVMENGPPASTAHAIWARPPRCPTRKACLPLPPLPFATVWRLAHTVSRLTVPPLGEHLAPGHIQQRCWERHSTHHRSRPSSSQSDSPITERDLQTPTASPTAVVESIRQPEGGFQTPTRFTVETRSLSDHRVDELWRMGPVE